MKIESIQLDRFGRYENWSLKAAPKGTQLFYGPNESGKTTLLEAIRFLLFGGKSKRFDDCQGQLVALREGKEFHIERRNKKLTVLDGEKKLLKEEPRNLWWHGLDRKTYDRIFAITLEDLQGADILEEVDLRMRFFGAEGGAKIGETLQDLEKSTGQLLVASANGKRRINVLMQAIEEKEAEIRSYGEHEAEFKSYYTVLDSIDRQEKEVKSRYEQWKDYGHSVELVLRAWDTYKRMEEAKNQMDKLADNCDLDQEAFMAVEAELDRCREQMRIWKGKEEQLMPQDFDPQSPLGIYGQQVESFYQEASQWERLQKECSEGRRYIERLQENLARLRYGFKKWQPEGDMPEDVDWIEGGKRAGALRDAVQLYQQWQLRQPQCPVEASELERYQQEKEAVAKQKEGLAILRKAVEEERERMLAPQAAPETRRVPMDGISKGAFTIALVLFVLFIIVAALSYVPATAKALGLNEQTKSLIMFGLCVGYVVFGGFAALRRNKKRVKALEAMEAAELAAKGAADTVDWDAVVAEYGLEKRPEGLADIEAMDRALEGKAVDEQYTVEKTRLAAFDEQEKAWKAEGEALAQQGEAAMEAWLQWLPSAAVQGLLDSDFLALKDEYEAYKREAREISQYEGQLKEHRERLEDLERKAQQLWTAVSFDGPLTPYGLRRLYSLVQNRRQNVTRWEQQEEQRRSYREEFEDWNKKEKDILLRRDEILHKSGLNSPSEYRGKLLQRDQYKQWEQIYKQSKEQLKLVAPKDGENHLFYRRLAGDNKAEWQAEYDRAQAESTKLEAELTQVYQQRGEVTETMRALSVDQALAKALQEKSQLEAQLEEALEDWATQVYISYCLEGAQKEYEVERQPAALARASQYIERMTEGRYSLEQPIAEDGVHLLTDQGQRVPLIKWSSGLADQVYLALRLSLAETFAERVEALPIILDDILLRFDEKRQEAALALLADLGQRQQIWIFSCQASLARIAERVEGIEVVELSRRN